MRGIFNHQAAGNYGICTRTNSGEAEKGTAPNTQALPEQGTTGDTLELGDGSGTCSEHSFKSFCSGLKKRVRAHFSSEQAVPRIIKGSTLGALGAGLVIGSLGLPGMIGLGAAGAAFGFALGAIKASKTLCQWAKSSLVEKNAQQAGVYADRMLNDMLKTGLKEALYGGAKGSLIGLAASAAACSPLTAAVLGSAAGAGISYLF